MPRPAEVVPHVGDVRRSGIFEINLINSTVRWTSGAYRLLGLKEGTVEPSIALLRSRIRGDSFLTRAQISDRAATGTPFDQICIVVDDDGVESKVSVHYEFVFDETGKAVKLIGLCWLLLNEL